MKKILHITLILLCLASAANAAPVLCFTDLVDGPKTGLGDGLGSGAIVTVWGWNLGSSQGASTITIGGVAPAYVYYWGNAGAGGNSGPADLYTHHKMQEIAFSIPAAVADGSVNIQATVGGVASNTLSFYVRVGSIYWAGDTPGGVAPNNSNAGTYAAPWATFSYTSGATTKVAAGDIIYGYGTTENSISIRATDGTSNNKIAMVSYPGQTCATSAGGIGAYNITDRPSFWVISKFSVTTLGGGIGVINNSRIIGNKIWDGSSTGNNPGTDCAEGGSGALFANSEQFNSKVFGNYVHDFGCQATSNQHHAMYFSSREEYAAIVPTAPIAPIEVGWNNLENNEARFGIHFFDENSCWGYTGDIYIHHNWVSDQVATGIDIQAMCYDGFSSPGDRKIYNNVLSNCGIYSPTGGWGNPINIFGEDLVGSVIIQNNTIYGGGFNIDDANEGMFFVPGDSYPSASYRLPAGLSWSCVNNIVVDVVGLTGFTNPAFKTPATHTDNVWYDTGALSAPTWDTSPIETSPLFTNAASGDLTLQAGSPALNSGAAPLSGAPFSGYGIDGSILDADIGAYGESGTAQATRSMGAKPGLLP